MVKLTREQWAEIYYALDSKAGLIENGDYGACDHGEDCTEQCDETWVKDLRAIMAAIGPDGSNAYVRGTAAKS